MLAPDLGLPAPRTMRNTCLLFKSPQAHGILFLQPQQTKINILTFYPPNPLSPTFLFFQFLVTFPHIQFHVSKLFSFLNQSEYSDLR